MIPQLFELTYVTARVAFPMLLLEVIRAEFFVRRFVREDVIRNRHNLMRDRNYGPLVPAAPLNSLIEGGERGRFRPTGGGGGFDERHAQGGIAMPRAGDAPLAGALFLAWTDAAPATQMAIARKLRHVLAGFGHDHFSRPLFDARNCLEPRHRRNERGELLGNPCTACRNDFFEKVDLREDLLEEEGVMRAEPALQRLAQGGEFAPQPSAGQVGDHRWIGCTPRQRLHHGATRQPDDVGEQRR